MIRDTICTFVSCIVGLGLGVLIFFLTRNPFCGIVSAAFIAAIIVRTLERVGKRRVPRQAPTPQEDDE